MTEPEVSICIPAYARPRELQEAILSVLRQDFDDLEVVVADDSGTLEPAVKEVADPRVKYFRNARRMGMAANWGAALDMARGSYRALLMDDDTLEPSFVSTAMQCFKADPSIDLVFTNHYFYERGRTWIRQCALEPGRLEDPVLDVLTVQPIAVSATLMRSEVWEAVRPLPDLLTADVVLQLRAASAGFTFFYVDEPLMRYRYHPGQLSKNETLFRDHNVQMWDEFRFGDPRHEGASTGSSRPSANVSRGN